MALPTGETLTTGVQNLRTWWDITEGRWLNESEAADESGVMVGAELARKQDLHAGDTLIVTGRHGPESLGKRAASLHYVRRRTRRKPGA